jgi:ATP dependent DNA ligase domain
MFKAFEFCIPTRSTIVPDGPDWLHEVKYDGYRLRLERDGDRVRLITRGGYDWTKRYPWIVEAALKNRQKRFVIDGEAVILGVDGISDFNALHSGKHNKSSFALSTSSLKGETICASCRCTYARPILNVCWHAGLRASSSTRSNAARTGLSCFARPVTWAWRDWCRSGATGHIRSDGRSIG